MKTVTFLQHHQFTEPQYIYQQAINTSINNAFTGDTLLVMQIVCMTPAAIFFAVCLIVHLYRKYTFKQKVDQLQQIANLERILRYKTGRNP